LKFSSMISLSGGGTPRPRLGLFPLFEPPRMGGDHSGLGAKTRAIMTGVKDAFLSRRLTDLLRPITLCTPECAVVLRKLEQARCETVNDWLTETFGAKGRSLVQDDLTAFLADRNGLEAVANADEPDPNVVVPPEAAYLRVFREIGINVEIGYTRLGATSLAAAQPAAAEVSTDATIARDAPAFIARQRERFKRRMGYLAKPCDLCTDTWMLSVKKALDSGQLTRWALNKCTAANELAVERTVRLSGSEVDDGLFMRHTAPPPLAISSVSQFLYVLHRRCVSYMMLGNCVIEPPATSPDVGGRGHDGTEKRVEPGGVHTARRLHTTPAPHTLYFAEFLRLAGGGTSLQELLRHDALAMGRVEQLIADDNYNLGSAVLAALEWPPVAGFLAGVTARGSQVASQAAAAMGAHEDGAARRPPVTDRRRGAQAAKTGQIPYQHQKPGGGLAKGTKTTKVKGKGKGGGGGGGVPCPWACKAYNNAAGCTKPKCKSQHCCNRCGHMGVKVGHTGCANP
jgi:hypothetical protein